MNKKRQPKQKPKFKEGDVVRIVFVSRVRNSWHDPCGNVCYAIEHVVSTFPEECLEPWLPPFEPNLIEPGIRKEPDLTPSPYPEEER